jgi:hypothetical protein
VIRPAAGALALLVVLIVSQHVRPVVGAAQQQPGTPTQDRLQGVVVHESTGQPVDSATVSLVGTDVEIRTGRFGGFSFPDPPLGMVSVRVTASGHPSVVEEVEVKSDGIVFLQFVLPSIGAVLSELLVGVPSSREMAGLTAADLLAIEVPSTRVFRDDVGQTNYSIRLRGAATTFLANVNPLIIIDGIMISGDGGAAMEALSQILASDVESLEVLRGPAAAIRYPLAANGVVVVTTRAGGGR